ncbi:N-6 DNA methylase [Lentibacillus sp. N15]|uniref:HsdM family class I SAM-dependent methyltransferase n=1 Tax=Lentibacillus songyuanensis TaxID=3136161 RepID=UPI0031BADC8F
MVPIDNIINELGYSESNSLYYRGDLKKESLSSEISLQRIRVLKELNPYAFYLVDNKPFVLFFEHIDNKEAFKQKHKEIWNFQTPIAIFDNEDHIEIYNGNHLIPEHEMLMKVQEINKSEVNELGDFSYWNITGDDFWRKFNNEFSRPSIDTVMLDNIKIVINKLQRKSNKSFAVTLTLRLIFIRFLIDRGVDIDFKGFTNNPSESRRQFLTTLKSKEALYNLFEHLKAKFNGNLFEFRKNRAYEMDLLDEESLLELYHLMSGEIRFEDGQLSLFPMYDFNIIPVELISNIYERLLGEEKQKEDSAFYTPPNLVDFILKQTVKPYLQKNESCRVLDPSCGSGIFLVETLRSIIESNLRGSRYFNDNKKLNQLLIDNIYGIDKNEEAVNVAIFSLYITLLDYKDPKCLKDFKLPELVNNNLFVDDFFHTNSDENLKNKKFDFILGNPPWGSVKNGYHNEYCKQKGIPNLNNEISRSFIARTKDFSNKDTQCCLIVVSKLFYNSKDLAKGFRRWLLTETKIEKFIELAAVRNLIFKKAKGPAAVIFYKFSEQGNEDNILTHLTLKPNIFFKLFRTIVIESNDKKKIPQNLLLNDDWAWKTIVYGTSHDYFNIKKLKGKFGTINNIIEGNGLASGTGLQVSSGKKSAKHLNGKKMIDSTNGITSFHVDLTQSTVFQQNTIHRTRDEHLFKPPYALLKKGFNTTNYKLKAAYSNSEFLYRDSIYGIAGGSNSSKVLLSLVGMLNSSFYAYLNLMLGTSAGIEREQAFPTEVLNFPATADSTLAQKVCDIQTVVNKNKKNLFVQTEDVDALIRDLDEYVLSCFNLLDDHFVQYALEVQIPLLTGGPTAVREANEEDLNKYAQPFINYWEDVLEELNQAIQVVIYPSIKNRFTAIEFKIVKEEGAFEKIRVAKEKEANLDLISKFALHKHNDLFHQMKDIINFEENSFYILKTNEYKNWHPAISELDLAKVIHSVLAEGEDNNEWI